MAATFTFLFLAALGSYFFIALILGAGIGIILALLLVFYLLIRGFSSDSELSLKSSEFELEVSLGFLLAGATNFAGGLALASSNYLKRESILT